MDLTKLEKKIIENEKDDSNQAKMLNELEKLVFDQAQLIQNMGKEIDDLKNEISRTSSHDSSVNIQLDAINRNLTALRKHTKLCDIDEIVRTGPLSYDKDSKVYRVQDTVIAQIRPG